MAETCGTSASKAPEAAIAEDLRMEITAFFRGLDALIIF